MMTIEDQRTVELLEINVDLRLYLNNVGTCKDRILFYKVLRSSGPQKAYQELCKRPGLNNYWLGLIYVLIKKV